MYDFKSAAEEDLKVRDRTNKAVQALAAGAAVLHHIVSDLVISEIKQGHPLPFVPVGAVIDALQGPEQGPKFLPVGSKVENLSGPHSHPGFQIG
jgi:hypothetical protein